MIKCAIALVLAASPLPASAQQARPIAAMTSPARELGPVLLLGLRAHMNRADVIARYPDADYMNMMTGFELAPGMIGTVKLGYTKIGGQKLLNRVRWEGDNRKDSAYQALIQKYGSPTDRNDITDEPTIRNQLRGYSATHQMRASWLVDDVLITYEAIETAPMYKVTYEAVDTAGLIAAF